ncbi:MAG: hypothetical protein CML02_02185 [Pseudooceanicola sp.]|nr:hypothetical protein [Pseudooceanicola sp.]
MIWEEDMKEFGKITGRAVIAIAAGVATTAGASAADFTMKFAGAGGAEDPSSKYIADYTECVQAESQNRIEVQHFPGTQLGGIGAQIQGLQLGTIEAASMAGQHMKSVEPSYGVIDAPGLFTSYKHANDTYWDPAFMEPYLSAGRDKGVMGVGIWAYGPSSFQTVDPVETIEDFKGLKLRILATEIEQRTANTIGAAGIQVDWSDIVPALQRGQIDGVHTNIVLAHAFKFQTVAKHVTLTNETMFANVHFMSTKFYDSLPDDLKAVVMECGKVASQSVAPLAEELGTGAEQKWTDAGGEVHRLNEAEQAEFMSSVAGIVNDVYGNDPALQDMYDLLKNTAQKHQPQG